MPTILRTQRASMVAIAAAVASAAVLSACGGSGAPVSEYARRPAPQGLDSHGRPAPVAPQGGAEDHLDIPAFLRRKAN